jgi:hypothetical protein
MNKEEATFLRCGVAVLLSAYRRAGGDDIDDGFELAITDMAKFIDENDGRPIDMILFCPNPECRRQHIDTAGPCHACQGVGSIESQSGVMSGACLVCNGSGKWDNPPHKSHFCHFCGCIWRPADVPTNGVKSIRTKGKADNWVVLLNAWRRIDERDTSEESTT